ncbi:MAG: DUF1810 domain-containing protein [Chloroflexota bacterium]|nr:DUF1810 domain-containing protein [Chloroflexota bacterium]MDE3194013.1 DUF1810 domain-containing protein [Chloroflexota bacterium]
MHDPHDLERFVEAQDGVYEQVKTELARGRKTSHWMWFVFPQMRGLGHSAMAERYGIGSAAEARAYWEHSLLGRRLKECVDLVLGVEGKTAREIMGSPDDVKLRSCLTLFEHVAPEEPAFARALEKYYRGERDPLTLTMLR